MNPNLKVSVCMITYNHEKYIQQALEGILMQVIDFDIEVIVNDDSSQDKTGQIILDLIANHPKGHLIKFTSQSENMGMTPNFINALEKCRAPYVALCEGDDYWTDPTKLQKQVKLMETRPDAAGTFHLTNFLNASHKSSPWRTYTQQEFHFEDTISTKALFHTSSFVFRNEKPVLPKWFSKITRCDLGLFCLVASKGPLLLINEFMSTYRKHSAGITFGVEPIAFHEDRIRFYTEIKKQLKSESLKFDNVFEFHRQI